MKLHNIEMSGTNCLKVFTTLLLKALVSGFGLSGNKKTIDLRIGMLVLKWYIHKEFDWGNPKTQGASVTSIWLY